MSEQQITIEDLMQEIKDYADSRRGAFVRREGDLYLKLEQFASQQRADAVQQLQQENAKLKEQLLPENLAKQAFLKNIDIYDGLNIGMNGIACQILAASFAGQFVGSGAKNYLTLDMHYPEIGAFTVTLQRKEGSSPADKLNELTTELAAAKQQLAEVEWQSIETAPKDGTHILLMSRKGRVADGVWVPVTSDNGYWAWSLVKQEPTHWMPMPGYRTRRPVGING